MHFTKIYLQVDKSKCKMVCIKEHSESKSLHSGPGYQKYYYNDEGLMKSLLCTNHINAKIIEISYFDRNRISVSPEINKQKTKEINISRKINSMQKDCIQALYICFENYGKLKNDENERKNRI
jgi:hypothetical protein